MIIYKRSLSIYVITTWRNGFAEIVNGFQSLITFIKISILDVSLGSKYASVFAHPYKTFSKYLNKIYSWKTNYIKMKILNEHTKYTKQTKILKKMSSKEKWLLISYFLISTQQPTLLKIGSFWQYFVPMSILLHLNLTRFFKFISITSIINLCCAISMFILCSCYMLNFWFYVQFDRSGEGK